VLIWDAVVVKNDFAGPEAPAVGTACEVQVSLFEREHSTQWVDLRCDDGFKQSAEHAGCNIYAGAGEATARYQARCVDFGEDHRTTHAPTPTPFMFDSSLGRLVYYGPGDQLVAPPDGPWRFELRVDPCSRTLAGPALPPGRWNSLVSKRQFSDPTQAVNFAVAPRAACAP
jgi:hypothetical protein